MRRPLALLATASLVGSLVAVLPAFSANAAPGQMVSAAGLLAQLPVQYERTSGYDRDAFDYGIDADRDGCNTRKEVLIRDALTLTKKSASCSVAGTWYSLYDNRTTDDVYSLEVDHLVALAEAWYSGAYAWTTQQRVAFGNDVGYKWDLQAVTSSVNQTKGAGDPAEWMPTSNGCTYVAAWIGVKYRWKLSVDPREKAALDRYLASCNYPLVEEPGIPDLAALSGISGGSAPAPAPAPVLTPTPAPTPVSTPTPAPAPPVASKHATTLKVSKLKRSGKYLSGKVTLTDKVTGRPVSALVELGRRDTKGLWWYVKQFKGSFKVKAKKGTYRVVFYSTDTLAASKSKTFKK